MPNKKSKGKRAKTRKKISKAKKLTINDLLREFSIGQKVAICINASMHKGMPFRRFHGLAAEIIGKQGNCYVCEFYDGNKLKRIITHAAHLKPLKP